MTTPNASLEPGSRVTKHPDIASRTIEEQEVVVVPRTRKMQVLNEVATRIWSLCDGRTVEEITNVIEQEYEVDRSEAHSDVVELVEDMLARGMVELS